MYALEWISKSHLLDVWNPPNPQSHVTENQWEKSLFLVFVSLSARYCLVIPQMDWAWLDSRFVRAQRFVKAPISVNLSQKSALSSGILNRLKIFFPFWFGCQVDVLFGINQIPIRVKSRRTGEEEVSARYWNPLKETVEYFSKYTTRLIAKNNCKPTKALFRHKLNFPAIHQIDVIRCNCQAQAPNPKATKPRGLELTLKSHRPPTHPTTHNF